jgi:hypothetical protein
MMINPSIAQILLHAKPPRNRLSAHPTGQRKPRNHENLKRAFGFVRRRRVRVFLTVLKRIHSDLFPKEKTLEGGY